MLRLDATTRKKWLGKLVEFKKFSIKHAFIIIEIFSSHVKVYTHAKKI